VTEFDGSEAVSLSAKCESLYGVHELEWSTYYPENARVPRLDPTGLSQKEIDRFYGYASEIQRTHQAGGRVFCKDYKRLDPTWLAWGGDTVLGHPKYGWQWRTLTYIAAPTSGFVKAFEQLEKEVSAPFGKNQRTFFPEGVSVEQAKELSKAGYKVASLDGRTWVPPTNKETT
jgi:hypothetical protein